MWIGWASAVKLEISQSSTASRSGLSVKGNLFWAFAYNVTAIPLALAGLLSPHHRRGGDGGLDPVRRHHSPRLRRSVTRAGLCRRDWRSSADPCHDSSSSRRRSTSSTRRSGHRAPVRKSRSAVELMSSIPSPAGLHVRTHAPMMTSNASTRVASGTSVRIWPPLRPRSRSVSSGLVNPGSRGLFHGNDDWRRLTRNRSIDEALGPSAPSSRRIQQS